MIRFIFKSKKVIKPTVNCYDIFDTLIARRCIFPDNIFLLVAKEVNSLSLPPPPLSPLSFLKLRKEAEQKFVSSGKVYGLVDIYEEMHNIGNLDRNWLKKAMHTEIDIERKNIYGIKENIDKVRDGDLLISDQYLLPENIRTFLHKAGLKKMIGLFVSNYGKKEGSIFQKLSRKFKIQCCTGDNYQSDIIQAKKNNIKTNHCTSSQLTEIENFLYNSSTPWLGELSREIRLRTFSSDPSIRQLQVIQADINFPLLLLSSVYLLRLANSLEVRNFFLCSRDCCLWQHLLNKLPWAWKIDKIYFLTSRFAKMHPTAEYIHYAQQLKRPNSLLVDIAGSALSSINFLSRFNIHIPLFIINQYANKEMAALPKRNHIYSPFYGKINSQYFEMMNYSVSPMFLGMKKIDNTIVPIFAKEFRNHQQIYAIKEQQKTFMQGLLYLDSYDVTTLYDLKQKDLGTLIERLLLLTDKSNVLMDIFYKQHKKEDKYIRELLRNNTLGNLT